MIMTIVCLAVYGLGWIMGFVTCTLATAVRLEHQKQLVQKAKIDALKPGNN